VSFEYSIPFNRASLLGNEWDYLSDSIESGHISGDGPYTRRVESYLESQLGTPRALLTTSCTHALEMAALLLDLEPGDEVVVPSFAFVSTANAFALRGAGIVFCDVRPDTLNLDEAALEEVVGPRTKAIVPLHYAGVGCELDRICALAAEHGAAVVEDNAHGLFGRYRGRFLGTFGPLSTQSFHETKNFTCGEGGALLVNDERYVDEAEIVREKGTNRRQVFRGMAEKYTWRSLGSSYVISDLLAAFLAAQFEGREAIQADRQRIWNRYAEGLADWAGEHGARLPVIPEHCEQTFHIFYLLLPSPEARTALIDHLRDQGIVAVFHYLPLHVSEMGLEFGGRPGACPVAEDISGRILRLPLYRTLSAAQQERVIDAVREAPLP
jgi:dTDP-4-amino-4,6-dideoxygalactose transaminase